MNSIFSVSFSTYTSILLIIFQFLNYLLKGKDSLVSVSMKRNFECVLGNIFVLNVNTLTSNISALYNTYQSPVKNEKECSFI